MPCMGAWFRRSRCKGTWGIGELVVKLNGQRRWSAVVNGTFLTGNLHTSSLLQGLVLCKMYK